MPETKHERMEALMAKFRWERPGKADPAWEYLRGYAECFNRGEYYEAHDVLEHYWLRLPRELPEWACFKGLIQFAGGFVHLRLHYLEPGHRVHGRRLAPAGKLFALAEENLVRTRPAAEAHGIDVDEVLETIRRFSPGAVGENPWRPETRPRVEIGL